MKAGLRIQDQKKLVKFDEVRNDVAKLNDLNLPDVVLDLNKIRLAVDNDVLLFSLPNNGCFQLDSWAKKQLGSALGVIWGTWFDKKIVNTYDIRQEIEKRFNCLNTKKKLRMRRWARDSGINVGDGYIRAFLGPTYNPIDDELIFSRMEKSLKGTLYSTSFIKNHLSAKGGWGNDHCSYYSLITEPVNIGGDEQDWIYPGYQIRNSEVGYTAVTINEFIFRLVCLNGMQIISGESRLLYRQHRPIKDDELDVLLNKAFMDAPGRWKLTTDNLQKLSKIVLAEPKEEIERQLKKLEAKKSFIEKAQEAYDLEPVPTMYGVLQAVTRAAHAYESMDKRFEIESLGGRLVSNAPQLV